MTHRRRAWFGVPFLLLLTLTVAGCGVGSALAGEAGGGQPGSTGSGAVTPDPGGRSRSGPDEPVVGVPGPVVPPPGDGALHVTPQPDIVDPIPHAFDHITVSGDGRTVTVYYWGGVEDCYGLHSVDVSRNADGTLVVTVLEGPRESAAARICIDIALLKAATVALDEPLAVADGGAGSDAE